MHRCSSSPLWVVGIITFLVVGGVTATSDKECAETVTGLATCLQYVVGKAKSPSPDCCAALKQVLKTSKKCLCLLIKDRNDPDLGLNIINVTLALSIPRVCATSANLFQCPALLGLDPNSPDAQQFHQLGKNASTEINTGPTVRGPTPTVVANPEGAPLKGGASPDKNGGCNSARIGMSFHITITLFYACVLKNF